MSNIEKRIERLEGATGGIPEAAIFLVYDEQDGKTLDEAIGEHCKTHGVTRDEFERHGGPVFSAMAADTNKFLKGA